MTEQEFIFWLRGYLDAFEENAITERIKEKMKEVSPTITTSGYIRFEPQTPETGFKVEDPKWYKVDNHQFIVT